MIVAAVGATVAAIAAGTAAMADDGSSGVNANSLHEHLTGYEEAVSVSVGGPLVAISTTGEGDFRVQIDENTQEITYELSYSSLEGNVLQAHIHFGAVAQAGGISAFLCTNLGNGPVGTPLCPPAPATVTGTIRPADVVGPAGQGLEAGNFDELIAAIRAGATYANVHSSKYPAGEIRAQLGH